MKYKAINVRIEYPDDLDKFQKKAADLLSSVLVRKLQPEEMNKLIELLEDKTVDIRW